MSDEDNFSTSTDSIAAIAVANDDCLIPSLRFPQKLWRIVNECKTGAISWSANGLSVLLNYKTFSEEYLNCENSIFKTINIASFIRQLNLYGFRKVTSHNRDIFGSVPNQDVHEFLHEHFRSGRLDLLSRVCRKTGVKKSLLQTKQGSKQLQRALGTPDSQNQVTGMTRLQMCQIALTKALEQATRQYRKEKFWSQVSNENIPKDVLKPKIKTEAAEPNIQIIFQDFSEIQDIENLPMIDISTIENVIGYQDKIQWGEVFTVPAENSVSISVPN